MYLCLILILEFYVLIPAYVGRNHATCLGGASFETRLDVWQS